MSLDIIHDLEKLVNIEKQCFPDPLKERTLKRFLKKNQVILRDEGYLIYIPQNDHVRVYSIAVLPEHRGKGIARELIQQLGNKKIILECKKRLGPFYQKLGFRITNSSKTGLNMTKDPNDGKFQL